MTDEGTGTQRPDPTEQVQRNADRVRALAEEEKKASRTVELGNFRWLLVIAVASVIVYLVAPVAGSVAGYEILLRSPAAVESRITPVETFYAWLLVLAPGLLTIIVLFTRHSTVAVAAWAFSGIGLFTSVLSLWLRQTRSTPSDGVDYRFAMYLSIVGVILAVIAYSVCIWRRSDEQRVIKEERSETPNLDEIGYAQRSVAAAPQDPSFETNPLFVDDRRQRAAERHERLQNPEK